MSVTIVVGAQYGSEGKGKVVALEASLRARPWVIRCGGPNSGHTVDLPDRRHVFRHLPAAAPQADATLLLSAGCAIDEAVLLDEIATCRVARDRLIIDPRAVLIEDEDRHKERATLTQLATTASGTGSAFTRRAMRDARIRFAGDSASLTHVARIEPTAPLIHTHLDDGGELIVEGTQGFGLSLCHGPHYPYVTSRDTLAASFASEVGLAPSQIEDVVLVVRTFPIRVGGPSGPLSHEITWNEVQRLSNAPTVVQEFTSVTNRLRRVAHFDWELAELAVRYNRPTSLAVMGLDRLNYEDTAIRNVHGLSESSKEFLRQLRSTLETQIAWAGTGFSVHDVIHQPDIGEGQRLQRRPHVSVTTS